MTQGLDSRFVCAELPTVGMGLTHVEGQSQHLPRSLLFLSEMTQMTHVISLRHLASIPHLANLPPNWPVGKRYLNSLGFTPERAPQLHPYPEPKAGGRGHIEQDQGPHCTAPVLSPH